MQNHLRITTLYTYFLIVNYTWSKSSRGKVGLILLLNPHSYHGGAQGKTGNRQCLPTRCKAWGDRLLALSANGLISAPYRPPTFLAPSTPQWTQPSPSPPSYLPVGKTPVNRHTDISKAELPERKIKQSKGETGTWRLLWAQTWQGWNSCHYTFWGNFLGKNRANTSKRQPRGQWLEQSEPGPGGSPQAGVARSLCQCRAC